ncbi:MAG: glycosyltransferase family 39 protein [Candidatus Shapirobacteria bacterium]
MLSLKTKKVDLLLCAFIVTLFFISHLMNFSIAPWNHNGLFDDAAWDIYFAKNHIFNGTPFQPAFFDPVGIISREVVFHYYLSVFFVLFGYNLLVFNVSLLILGCITVFFTTLLIQRLFNNMAVTMLSAVMLNFLPFHFMHVFRGDRYAIVAPLMMISLYFLYTAFLHASFLRTAISAIFAALCFGSAIMGKHYLYGVVLAALLFLITDKNRKKISRKLPVALVWLGSFLLAAAPMLIYIGSNYAIYTLRERSLINEFFLQYKQGGFQALIPYLDRVREIFFAKYSYLRQFVPGFYLIPLAYYLLLVPGLLIALLKRHFEIVFLALIPIVGAFISGAYDFRILMAVPIWVVAMAFALNTLFVKKIVGVGLGLGIIVVGLLPSINYIWMVSRDPNYLYLLPHKDVAVSRLVQDIVVGVINPTSEMKQDEFNRKVDLTSVSYDTLVCPLGAYAIMHVYLQNYNDKKILAFCDQGIQLLKTPTEILHDNIRAIINYSPTDKDLKLAWEVSEKSEGIVDKFRPYRQYGHEEEFKGEVDGVKYSLYVLTIDNEFIEQFKKEVVWGKLAL